MSIQTITVEAIFEAGVLRPVQPLPFSEHQHVMLTLQIPPAVIDWPENVAAIYHEIAEEDRRLAEAMRSTVKETWPTSGEQT